MSFSIDFSKGKGFNIASESTGKYPFWKVLPQGTDPEKHIMMCFIIGDEAKRVERL